ncbi:copper chaperone PCu(A)C [Neisseria leonii]|uniref:Copper chaperone PCu(A)C n=1 Tax=Neisseria leonii TaxID=2995413 RepID=A0A9X4E2W4_9NEIS|nr:MULTISPECIES: copper chaperone PCu(A)C [unclassified Neisseria]MDD9324704.1 copper chaperone PCu(A)C [Neisseria sp. 3986]MDD9327735.1 copper chaperone PCu(A)C [Neisseria sp. 51.81]
MKKTGLALLLAAVCQGVFAAGIEADDVWARATVQGMSMGGVFMKLENDSGRDDVLLGGSTPLAERVEVHNHVNDNGVMRMRRVEGGLPLKNGAGAVLKPGSYHIMLMGLKQPLDAGQKFPLTLEFQTAQPKTVTVTVKANHEGMPAGHQGGHQAGKH